MMMAMWQVVFSRVRMETSIDRPGASLVWHSSARVAPSQLLDLEIIFSKTAHQYNAMEKALLAVSDPDSPEYGKHWTQERIDALMAPTSAARQTVLDWLISNGVKPPPQSTGDVLSLSLPAVLAESLLETEFHEFVHRERRDLAPIIRANRPYSLPEPVARVISMVGGVHGFPEPQPPLLDVEGEEGVEADNDAGTEWPTDCGSCSSGFLGKRVTPAVLSAVYGIPLQNATAGNDAHAGSLAVAEFQGVYWDPADMNGYAATCKLPAPINFTQVGYNNPKRCKLPIIIGPDTCVEALLDIQVVKGLDESLPLTDFFQKGYSILGWAQMILGLPDGTAPLVHSVSYGNDESQQTSDEYIQEVNVALQKLGTRGFTVFFASGDGGVAGRRGSGSHFAAGFPASSPWATAVGGTDFVVKNQIGEEKAWYGSGGGFSYKFGRPSYQAAAVSSYLAKAKAAGMLPANPSAWNSTGRGFPDVAALGGVQNKYCIVAKRNTGAAGTSAATPVLATTFAKLNVLRAAKGKPPLGFVNPLLYRHPEAFHDVTKGCNSRSDCSKRYGFAALPGWDPTTGLGTPKWEGLVKMALGA